MKKESAPIPNPNPSVARQAGLHYVSDGARSGLKRLRSRFGFHYVGPTNLPVRSPHIIARIRKLAIPPAWREVWICPDPQGHIQATGRDAKGRKQYRYHPHWRVARDENKFDRMLVFGKALPRMRRVISRHLRKSALTREKVLATVVRLLELSAARVGNEEYVVQNGSYGLTTLRNRHVKVNGSTIHFRFRGKSGKDHHLTIAHPGLARVVRKCQHLPGQKLFQYVADDGLHDVTSDIVNDYLASISGLDFTAKDFRTWAATTAAARILARLKPAHSQQAKKQNILQMINEVAKRLGNTPAICKKCYIHPAVIDCYFKGAFATRADRERTQSTRGALRAAEIAVVDLLRKLSHPSLYQKHTKKASFRL